MGGIKIANRATRYIKDHSSWFILGMFSVCTFAITSPFILNPANTLISPVDGDAGYSSIIFEGIKREHLNPFIDGRLHSIAYPDGVAINTGVNRVSFFSTSFLWIGTLLTNAVFTHSLMAIIGTILSAQVVYLFVKKLTGRTAPSLVAGFIIGFSPLMMTMLFSAYPYTHMWLYVAIIWCFWHLATQPPSKKRFVYVFTAVFLSLFWTPYYTYHILLIAGTSSIVVATIYARRHGAGLALKYIICVGGLLILYALLYYLIGKSTQYAAIPTRTIEEIYQQSAHPLMYVLPGVFTIFGKGLYHLLVELVPRAAYTSLFIGVSTIGVALFSLVTLRRQGKYSREIKYAVILCASVVGVSFAFSLAPTVEVFGMTIPTPNYLVAEFTPALRAGQRLAMPLISAFAVLCGIGLYVIQKRLSGRYGSLALIVIVIIMFFELASFPPERYTTLENRVIFNTFSQSDPALTAVYLNNSLVSNPGQNVCYPQFQYKMPIVNDCAIQRNPYDFNRPTPTLLAITQEPLCKQLDILYNEGVGYLVISKLNNHDMYTCLARQEHFSKYLGDDQYDIYKVR